MLRVRSTDARREFGQGAVQLVGYFDGRQAITAIELGVAQGESRAQGEGQQEDERDGGQPTVRNRLAPALGRTLARTVAAGVQKAMLESPVLGEIIPPVVLLFPARMAESAHEPGGKGLRAQGGRPEPFLSRGFRLPLAAGGSDSE